ncbi:hypothetical protein ES703_87582 [subsurface metagenome]
MVSVRACLEAGQTDFARAEFLERRGNVPMCCYIIHPDGSLSCDSIRVPLRPHAFRKICLRCQMQMAEKLGV